MGRSLFFWELGVLSLYRRESRLSVKESNDLIFLLLINLTFESLPPHTLCNMEIEMKPIFACIIGMMIGSIVLLSSAFYKPHDLSLFQSDYEKQTLIK